MNIERCSSILRPRRRQKRSLFLIACMCLWSTFPAIRAIELTHSDVEHPFRNIAAWLKEGVSELEYIDRNALSRAITILSKSESTLKSFDGIAHELGGKMKQGTSTADAANLRNEALLSKSSAAEEKALKLMELLVEIENALNSAEIAECLPSNDISLSNNRAAEAGLHPIQILPLSPSPSDISVEDEGTERNPQIPMLKTSVDDSNVFCRIFDDEKDKRLLIVLSDDLSGAQLLCLTNCEPSNIPFNSKDLPEEDMVQVLPSVWTTAISILESIEPTITDFLKQHEGQGYRVHCVGHSYAGSVSAILASLIDGIIHAENVKTGICKGKVSCVTFGSPPCLSPSVKLPFVTSFVLGDDFVPRLSRHSLEHLKRRLSKVLPKKTGVLGRGLAIGSTLFTDVAGITAQGLQQRKMAQIDKIDLIVPGKIWFIKPRRLHGVASMNRVGDGAIREDVLWQLHDIMLTKSMLSHHQLSRYIECINKV